jgi:hypothetical protein
MGRNYAGLISRSGGLIFLGLVFVSAQPAAGQPSVSSVSGTVSHGQTVVISGGSFGTKSAAAPLAWEDFNDGVLDAALENHGNMSVSNTDNLRHPFSSRNARANYKTLSQFWDGYYFGYAGNPAPKWYVQYWIKLAPNWHWGTSDASGGDKGLANIKFFRLFPTGSRNYPNIGYSIHGFSGGDMLRFVENGEQVYKGVDARSWFTPGVWHSVQVEFNDSSGANQNNGTLKLWVDGVLRDSTTTLNTHPSGDGAPISKRPLIMGFYDSWPPSTYNASTMYAYYSDIYVDNTWARVELGNASTYAASTYRETQLPTSWGSSSVSFRVNQGTFGNGQTAYIYVVDSSGRVNANGYPVTIGGGGGGGGPQPPAAPSGLRIISS